MEESCDTVSLPGLGFRVWGLGRRRDAWACWCVELQSSRRFSGLRSRLTDFLIADFLERQSKNHMNDVV